MPTDYSERAPSLAAQSLQQQFHQAMAQIDYCGPCAVLDAPRYPNLGDHLIWLGSVLYLTTVKQCAVNYTADLLDFDAAALAQQLPEGPIFLLGGGNFGDLWPHHQAFRERIIAQYPDRPIVILPQTLYFQRPKALAKARRVLNAHPNLTLFVRDRTSYDIACQAFENCRVLLSPDAAFHLTPLADFDTETVPAGLLYHRRTDTEQKAAVTLPKLSGLSLTVSDWPSYEDHWLYDNHWLLRPSQGWVEVAKRLLQVRALGHGYRSLWQRRFRHPQAWRSLHRWETALRPDAVFDATYNAARQRQSWSFIHSAIYQFRRYQAVVTDRLHGHILCTLLNIPHVFLPNSYHKNQGFYEAWTAPLPNSRFVQDPECIPTAIAELIAG